MSARKKRRNVKHWDLLHDLIEQDTDLGMNKTKKVETPWPLIPPLDIGTMEQEWMRYRNVAQLVSAGAIQPPKWYRQSRLAPPTSGPFWGDPPVSSMEHQYPLRRHFWTRNLKPPTELMKVFFLRKEDMVLEKNYKRVIGFTPREKARQQLKEDVAEASAQGRSTFNFFWQKKPLEKMETRFWQLKEEGLTEKEAHDLVAKEFYEVLATRKRQQSIAAETARRSGKYVSCAARSGSTHATKTHHTQPHTGLSARTRVTGFWISSLPCSDVCSLSTTPPPPTTPPLPPSPAQLASTTDPIDRSLAEVAGKDLSYVAATHAPEIVHGEKPEDENAVNAETTRYMEYTGLQPDMMAFEVSYCGFLLHSRHQLARNNNNANPSPQPTGTCHQPTPPACLHQPCRGSRGGQEGRRCRRRRQRRTRHRLRRHCCEHRRHRQGVGLATRQKHRCRLRNSFYERRRSLFCYGAKKKESNYIYHRTSRLSPPPLPCPCPECCHLLFVRYLLAA